MSDKREQGEELADIVFKNANNISVIFYYGQEVEDMLGDIEHGIPQRDFTMEDLYQAFKARLLREFME